MQQQPRNARWRFGRAPGIAALITGMLTAGFLVLGEGSALAAAPVPLAVTGAASSISSSSAVVSGSVNPRGTSTDWYFQYGRSASYGAKTATSNVGAGETAVNITSPITGLLPSTTYHFRLVATSAAGTNTGADTAFMTASIAPNATTNSITNLGGGAVRLIGVVDPNGQPTSAHFDWGTTTALGSSTGAQSVGSANSGATYSMDLAGLSEDATYYFKIVATNPTGTSSGAVLSFMTSGPPIVMNGAVSGVTTSGAVLHGTVNPASRATSWYFQYGPSSSYGKQTGTKSAGSGDAAVAVAASIGGFGANTNVYYRLVAVNASGTVGGSGATFMTLGPTLVPQSGTVVYGHGTMLTGTLPDGAANQGVAVYAQRAIDSSFVLQSTVLSGSNGTWALSIDPLIATTYKVVWDGETSAPATISVTPVIRFHVVAAGRFWTRVATASSLQGRIVQLQRLDRAGWRTIARNKLRSNSSAYFSPKLPSGGSRLRVVIDPTQVGTGYLGATSSQLVFRH